MMDINCVCYKYCNKDKQKEKIWMEFTQNNICHFSLILPKNEGVTDTVIAVPFEKQYLDELLHELNQEHKEEGVVFCHPVIENGFMSGTVSGNFEIKRID